MILFAVVVNLWSCHVELLRETLEEQIALHVLINQEPPIPYFMLEEGQTNFCARRDSCRKWLENGDLNSILQKASLLRFTT